VQGAGTWRGFHLRASGFVALVSYQVAPDPPKYSCISGCESTPEYVWGALGVLRGLFVFCKGISRLEVKICSCGLCRGDRAFRGAGAVGVLQTSLADSGVVSSLLLIFKASVSVMPPHRTERGLGSHRGKSAAEVSPRAARGV